VLVVATDAMRFVLPTTGFLGASSLKSCDDLSNAVARMIRADREVEMRIMGPAQHNGPQITWPFRPTARLAYFSLLSSARRRNPTQPAILAAGTRKPVRAATGESAGCPKPHRGSRTSPFPVPSRRIAPCAPARPQPPAMGSPPRGPPPAAPAPPPPAPAGISLVSLFPSNVDGSFY